MYHSEDGQPVAPLTDDGSDGQSSAHGVLGPDVTKATAADWRHWYEAEIDRLRAERDGLWQALVDIAGWENWQAHDGPTWREIAQVALVPVDPPMRGLSASLSGKVRDMLDIPGPMPGAGLLDVGFPAHQEAPEQIETVPLAELVRLRAGLLACAEAAGEDVSDGIPSSPDIVEWATQAVRECRRDREEEYEETHALAEVAAAGNEREKALEAVIAALRRDYHALAEIVVDAIVMAARAGNLTDSRRWATVLGGQEVH